MGAVKRTYSAIKFAEIHFLRDSSSCPEPLRRCDIPSPDPFTFVLNRASKFTPTFSTDNPSSPVLRENYERMHKNCGLKIN